MKQIGRLAVLAFLATGAASAQPSYEVASVKLSTAQNNNSSSNGDKGEVFMRNLTLKRLIERAYNAQPFQVTGPDWLQSVRVDIAARYPPDTKTEDRALMLRSLLEERFKLAVHTRTQEMPGYALVVAKNGFKLKPAEPGGGPDTNTQGHGLLTTLTVKKTSMVQLADLLARNLGEMVIDSTGQPGVYDFEVRWTNDDQRAAANADDDSAPSIFTALQETLGLRLQPQKVPVQVVVVDHMERVPTEN